MLISSIKFKLSLVVLFLCFTKNYANTNNDTIKSKYNSLSAFDKIEYFNKLNYKQKKLYKDFFYKKLPLLLNDKKIQSDKENLKKLRLSLLEIYSINAAYAKMITVYKSILDDKTYKSTDPEYMDLLIEFQKTYLNLSLYSKAFQVNSEIEKLRKKGSYFPLSSYNIKSQLYARLFLYDKAISQLKFEIDEVKRNPKRDSITVPLAYNDLGFYYFNNSQNDSALYYYNLSLKVSEKALKNSNPKEYSGFQGLVKGNLGALYIKQKNYKLGIPLVKMDLAVSLKNNVDNNNSLRTALLLAESYSNLKNYKEASKIIKLADELFKKDVGSIEKARYYKVKSEFLRATNRTEEAYILFEKAFKLKDSINLSRQQLLLAGNEIIYQLEEKDDLIAQQQIDINNKQQNMILLLVTGLLIIAFTSFLYVTSSKKKRKKIQDMNTEISLQNKVIKESLLEKETLLKEVHHRVKNNLQIISGILELQNLNVTDPNTKIILQEGQARIQSIALVHKTLYQSEKFSTLTFQNYLTELVSAIESSHKRNSLSIKTSISAIGIELSINTAVPLSLIINEIVTNSFKHAFKSKEKGNLAITVIKRNKTHILIIEDDGNGLPSDFNLSNLTSIGFDLIQGLTKQIGGFLEVKSENGTKITITFEDN